MLQDKDTHLLFYSCTYSLFSGFHLSRLCAVLTIFCRRDRVAASGGEVGRLSIYGGIEVSVYFFGNTPRPLDNCIGIEEPAPHSKGFSSGMHAHA